MNELGKHRGDAMISSIVAAAVTGAICLGVAKTVGTTMQSQTKAVGSVHATTYADSRIQILKNTPYDNLTPISKTEIKNLGEAGVKYYESVEFDEETTTEPIGKWATISIYEDDKTEAIGKFRYFCLKGGVAGVPKGTIVMWSGTTIPEGWHVCDGSIVEGKQLPDLRGKFVVGAGLASTDKYKVKDVGGSDSVTLMSNELPSHNHNASGYTTQEAGSHVHDKGTFRITGRSNSPAETYYGGPSGPFYLIGSGGSVDGHGWNVVCLGFDTNRDPNCWTGTTGWAGNHSHSISFTLDKRYGNASGNADAHENRPSYYAVYYIIKL